MDPTRRQRPPADRKAAAQERNASNRLRRWLDHAARGVISLGGTGVIVTLLLLFVFLLYEVAPLFRPATIAWQGEFVLPAGDAGRTLQLAVEEQAELGFRLDDRGAATFFRLSDGELVHSEALPVAAPRLLGHTAADDGSGLMAVGLDTGAVVLFAHQYRIVFTGQRNLRTIIPALDYPVGREPIPLGNGNGLVQLAVAGRNDALLVAALDSVNRIHLLRASRQRNLISAFSTEADAAYSLQFAAVAHPVSDVEEMLIDSDRRRLILRLGAGRLLVFAVDQIFDGTATVAAEFELPLVPQGELLTKLGPGGRSLLVAGSDGRVHQFLFADTGLSNPAVPVRSFIASEQPLTALVAEQRRKHFISIDRQGLLRAFHTTARRETFRTRVAQKGPLAAAVAPRGDLLLLEPSPGQFSVWQINNPHPEVSWSALWGQVWYEGYTGPDYVWQSSATDNAFEPKYSLVPLAFGTLKAAFYGMLVAAPLAVGGAIYTGYFMASAMRRKVKPAIELMEALPTVVLGFLAGLWLAPLAEQHLLGLVTIVVLLPWSVVVVSLGWYLLPRPIRHSLPDGWEAALVVPVVLVCGWLSLVAAVPLETVFFDGDLPGWMDRELGISYQQRNALVVGFAMGFAIIPTVFSLAEDAVFAVPRHLTYGSLALGATPWQSLTHVVLPTASPGIFSAVLIGLGRAVGETMIVLMATGNTPLMDINPFTGMRTLAANIAIEIPESAVASTHYRILFLAALVLFLFTFVINTLAEVVRQRLRGRYSVL